MSAPDQCAIRAVYARGGTSRALLFHADDLPPLGADGDRAPWDAIFAAALGSPDPLGRQLDGLGGGISSLSKVAVIARSQRPDADIDFTFAQVAVTERSVSYRGNCGNIAAAIGPFAVDEGLVRTVPDGDALVRIYNTNTAKIIHACFAMRGGKAAVRGDCAIQGVAGTGAPVRLVFFDPGGAITGRLLPTGNACDRLNVPGVGPIELSMVDAANPVVFVTAEALGLAGDETPDAIAADAACMAALEEIRVAAALAMRVVVSETEARERVTNLPLVAIVSPAGNGEEADIRVRMISAGQPHKATPLTGAMCLAITAKTPGTLAARLLTDTPSGDIRIAHASGVLPVAADVRDGHAHSAIVYRTARRLMAGDVLVPAT